MKKFLLKTAIPTFTLVTVLGLSPINTANAQENTSGITHNDLEEDRFKETIKTKKYDEWKKTLTPNDIDSLELFKDKDINNFIKYADGNIDFIHDADGIIAEDIRKSINNLDSALKKSIKLENSIHVYKYLTNEDLDFRMDSLYAEDNNNKIDRDKYQSISENFKYGISKTFLDPHLIKQKPVDPEQSILLDLKLSKGEHVGYLDTKGHILLKRNQGIVITNSSIIVEDGREIIKLEAHLVDKNKVENKIQNKEDTLNEIIRKTIEKSTAAHKENEIPMETKFIKIHTNSLNASFSIKRVEDLVHNLIQNVPRKLLITTLQKMNPNAAIIITDSFWKNTEKELGLEHNASPFDLGSYYDQTKQLILNLRLHNHQTDPFREIKKTEPALGTDVQTLIHEFGHAVDNLILNDLSEGNEFESLYRLEKNNIRIENYMKQDSVEFFASAFSYIFSPNKQYQTRIQEEVPQTVEFIQNELKKKGF